MIGNEPRALAVPNSAASDLTPQMARVQEAGFVSRLAAFVIDIVIVTLSSIVFAALVSLILNFFGFSARDFSLEAPARDMFALLQLIIIALAGLAVLLFIPAYFVICWVLVGATPGKRILGLRVMRTGSQRISWWRAIVRFVGYWISALPLFLGFLWVLVDARRQGWHDKLAGTIVAYTWPVLESEDVQRGPNTDLTRG
jgi:uncharacterized RDD family membrane protein YckC